MNIFRFARGLAALLILAAAAAASAASPGTYRNPVIDADFADPALVRAPDGYYYAYATQSERGGRMLNIQVARSRNLVAWTHLGDALPTKPGWAAKTQDFWAPHVIRHGRRYILYYSAKPDAALTDDKRGLCLAAATATSPRGPFTDMGRPLQCGDSFVEIDPMAYRDPASGKWLLYWGSGFKPIKVQELGPDGLSFAAGSVPRDIVFPNPDKDAFPRLIEGAWLLQRDGFYYLFYSGDNCCGPKADYAVMVARSRSPTGPFETLEQTGGAKHSIILGKAGKWAAPGHNAIVTDAAGAAWIVYHAVDVRKPKTKPSDDINTRRIMLVDRLHWQNGWPYTRGPSTGRQRAPAVGIAKP